MRGGAILRALERAHTFEANRSGRVTQGRWRTQRGVLS